MWRQHKGNARKYNKAIGLVDVKEMNLIKPEGGRSLRWGRVSWKNSLVARIEGDLGLIPSIGYNARESMKNIVLENSFLHELTDYKVYHN